MMAIQMELFERSKDEIVDGKINDLEKAQGNLRRGTFVRLEEQDKKRKDLEMETIIRFEEQNIKFEEQNLKLEKLEEENLVLKSSIRNLLEKLNEALYPTERSVLEPSCLYNLAEKRPVHVHLSL